MPDSPRIADLIPHQGAMCLLEHIVSWDETHIVLTADNHRSPTHPLAANGKLRAVHLCEYGAQAMAVHGALVGQAQGVAVKPGLLVSLREVALHLDYIHELPLPLEVQAERQLATESGLKYRFTVNHDGSVIASGFAMVLLGKG